jgi:hypothetical protein
MRWVWSDVEPKMPAGESADAPGFSLMRQYLYMPQYISAGDAEGGDERGVERDSE